METLVCETCGYDLRGSPQQGNCPECSTEYDQAVLWANQTRSVRGVLIGLRILAFFVVLVVVDVLVLIVSEDFLGLRIGPRWWPLMGISIPGTLLLLAVLGGLLIWLKHGERLKRPFHHPAQLRILPPAVMFWIAFNFFGLMIGMFFGCANPLWKLLYRIGQRWLG